MPLYVLRDELFEQVSEGGMMWIIGAVIDFAVCGCNWRLNGTLIDESVNCSASVDIDRHM